ncbi:unnamed protein product [Caenorhabditis auriculariae]|uniref:Uncharacterized protein n=1 Tax=Caenorhabditis auriculariae TaxID=2777116 RepID=A0A8S1GWV1_9PELO|nr:unnamed protein product [Caenorhabditis auriculariae]
MHAGASYRRRVFAFCLVLLASVRGQRQYQAATYQNAQYGNGYQGAQSNAGFQAAQSNSGYQQSNNQQSRYQTQQFVVPGNNYGGQFKEQRVITVQENIQGSAQQGAGYGYNAGINAQGGSSNAGYQFSQQYGSGASGFQSRGGQQGMIQYRGNQQQAGRSVVVNSPVMFSSGSVLGAQVDIRLTSYANTNLNLMNGTTCMCPINNCNYIPANQQNQCLFSFVIVISAADQSIQYIQSDFYPMPNNGLLTSGNWTIPYSFQMNTKPVAIDIFVQHLGVVMDSQTAQLLFFNHLALVDSFVVDLINYSNSGQNGPQALTLVGQQQGTQLQISLNVQCINNMMGQYCDLQCNNANIGNSNTVICFSNRTNTYSACKWNSYRSQVTDCYVCTHGTYNGTCNGAVIYTNNGGVAYAFRTWTIVLGVLLGIALLLILCLIISYIIVRNREASRSETFKKNSYENGNYDTSTSYSRESKQREGSTSQALLSEEWSTSKPKPTGILAHTTARQNEQAESEDSYMANGVQQTTTTTTTTTRREHVV